MYYHSIEIQKLLQLVVFQKTVPYLCIRTPQVRDLNANHTAKYFILILDHEQYVDFPRWDQGKIQHCELGSEKIILEHDATLKVVEEEFFRICLGSICF